MIALIIPSKGRPDRCAGMIRSARATATERVRFLVVIPHEQDVAAYHAVVQEGAELLAAPTGFVRCVNAGARALRDDVSILGVFGDDVIFQTPGWDQKVEAALVTPGMAYGDDLIHGPNHPSAVWVSSEIVRALGWLAHPELHHQWADDVWRDLFTAAGCKRYLPDVVVEHVHPAVGKAPMDATYEAVFGANEGAVSRAAQDHATWQAWKAGDDFERDVRAVRKAMR